MSEAGEPEARVGDPSLGGVAARGAAITLFGQGGRIAIQMLGIAVLARLLTPEDYGLVAMVAVIVSLGEIFRDFGLSAAAVQRADLSKGQRDNLWWANTGIGFILFLAVAAASGLVAWFFDEPLVGPIAVALASTFLINGMSAQYRASLTREMRFGVMVVNDILSQSIGLAVGIGMALSGFGYWSLVYMQVATAVAALVLLIAAARWIPGRPHRGEDMAGFWRFGWNLVGSQLLGFFSAHVDAIVIGRNFGAGSLGVYDRSYRLLMVPLSQIRTPATTVALPVLSKLQDDHDRFNRFLIRGQLALGYTVVAALGFGAGAADPVIGLFLGQGWEQAVPIFALLALSGALQTLSFVGYWVYLSRALTDRLLRYSAFSALVRVGFIIVGAQWGLLGVAAAVAIAPAVLWPISLWWLSRATPLPLRELFWGGTRMLILALMCAATSRVVTEAMATMPDLLALVAAGAASAGVYLLLGLLVPAVRRDELAVWDVARRVLRRA